MMKSFGGQTRSADRSLACTLRGAALAAAVGLASMASAQAVTIYDSIPNPLPGNVVSLGYQATSTSGFGDRIAFAGTARDLLSATVTLSSWAKASDWAGVGDANGYIHPLTLGFYNVGAGGAVGSLIGSVSQNALIEWRPEVFNFNGKAFNVTFDFSSQGITLPDEVIFSLSFNTQTYGASPLGTPGPYNSLNFGLIASVDGPSVGTDVDASTTYWDSTYLGRPAGLSPDGEWEWTPSILVTAVPEPESVVLALAAMGVIAVFRRRRAESPRST